jgi:hypothetical protein
MATTVAEVEEASNMETLVERCAGLDVHKDSVTACVRVPNGHGGPSRDPPVHHDHRGVGATGRVAGQLRGDPGGNGVDRVLLEAVADGAQPSAPVDHRPVEVGPPLLNLPGMHRHPHRQREGSGQGSAAKACCSSKAAATACAGLVKTLKLLSPSPWPSPAAPHGRPPPATPGDHGEQEPLPSPGDEFPIDGSSPRYR